MFTIYVYILETLADWELGYVTSELHSRRFFKKDAECVSFKTVSYSKEPIHTMGGLTTALANFGLLDNRRHTSNGQGFLEMFSSTYKGQSFYIDEPSVADNNLITANPTGSLLWAKQIIERLGVFQSDTLEFWYEYFSTGKAESFFALMQTLPPNNEK